MDLPAEVVLRVLRRGLWTSLGGEEHGEIPCSGESHRVSCVV